MAIRHYLTNDTAIRIYTDEYESIVLCDECDDFLPFITPSETYAIERADEHYENMHTPVLSTYQLEHDMVRGRAELMKDITRLTQEIRQLRSDMIAQSQYINALETRIKVLEQ